MVLGRLSVRHGGLYLGCTVTNLYDLNNSEARIRVFDGYFVGPPVTNELRGGDIKNGRRQPIGYGFVSPSLGWELSLGPGVSEERELYLGNFQCDPSSGAPFEVYAVINNGPSGYEIVKLT